MYIHVHTYVCVYVYIHKEYDYLEVMLSNGLKRIYVLKGVGFGWAFRKYRGHFRAGGVREILGLGLGRFRGLAS